MSLKTKPFQIFLFSLFFFILNCSTLTTSKSLPSPSGNGDNESSPPQNVKSQQRQQQESQPLFQPPPSLSQTPQQSSDVHYPNVQDENDNYSYDYHSSSSEEMAPLPVKNAEFVPEESSGEDYNITGGYIPQRRESLQNYWMNQNNPLLYQNNYREPPQNGGEGTIEHVTQPPQSQGQSEHQMHSEQLAHNQMHYQGELQQQNYPYQQQPLNYYYDPSPSPEQQQIHPDEVSITSTVPPPVQPPMSGTMKKKSNVDKLVVEARRSGDGKIAVVKDKFRSRQRRSMMTLSREDENDSEYDDLSSGSGEKVKSTPKPKNKTSTTTNPRAKS